MRVNISKVVFTTREVEFITAQLEQAAARGLVVRRTEANPYLLASYMGVAGHGISPKWNVKVYAFSPKKGGHSIVCVDLLVLRQIVDGDLNSFTPPALPALRIDDAGWGFPLCGVMVGVSDEATVETATVPVEYFRDDSATPFATKLYLEKYAELAVQLLEQFGATPQTQRIEICSGYVNQPLREKLRQMGYDVRVVEIRGLLQEKLEALYRAYVLVQTGADIYYDPKDIAKKEIPRRYRESLAYGVRHCPHLVKTGWEALNGNAPGGRGGSIKGRPPSSESL